MSLHYQKIKRDFHNGTASAPGTPIKPAVPKTASSKCGRKRKGDEQCDFNGDSTPIKSAKSKLIGGPDDGSPTRKKVRADKTSATLTDSLEANEKPQGGKDSTGDTTEEEA
ncbi:MAG: hypothetical protein M1832_001270 [Thelocarpon impressellum]|nr:MAG: hypothetical protein M1832_001270 [Thelocarpon impressellum]